MPAPPAPKQLIAPPHECGTRGTPAALVEFGDECLMGFPVDDGRPGRHTDDIAAVDSQAGDARTAEDVGQRLRGPPDGLDRVHTALVKLAGQRGDRGPLEYSGGGPPDRLGLARIVG